MQTPLPLNLQLEASLIYHHHPPLVERHPIPSEVEADGAEGLVGEAGEAAGVDKLQWLHPEKVAKSGPIVSDHADKFTHPGIASWYYTCSISTPYCNVTAVSFLSDPQPTPALPATLQPILSKEYELHALSYFLLSQLFERR